MNNTVICVYSVIRLWSLLNINLSPSQCIWKRAFFSWKVAVLHKLNCLMVFVLVVFINDLPKKQKLQEPSSPL